MTKREYKNPKIDVFSLKTLDIIRTSGQENEGDDGYTDYYPDPFSLGPKTQISDF